MSTGQSRGRGGEGCQHSSVVVWAVLLQGGGDVMKRLRNLSAAAGWDEDKDINMMNQDIIQTGTGRQI